MFRNNLRSAAMVLITTLIAGPVLAAGCNDAVTLAGDVDPGHAAIGRDGRYDLPNDEETRKACAEALAANPGDPRLKLLNARLVLANDSADLAARSLLSEAIAAGSVDALVEAAHYAETRPERVALLTRAAEAPSPVAIRQLADLHFPSHRLRLKFNGRYMPLEDQMRKASATDIKKARRWLARAGELGDAEAKVDLAKMWDAGIGGKVDRARSRRLLAMANTRYARYLLAGMDRLGKGAPVDIVAARAGFEATAKEGQIDAYDELGEMLEDGIGGPPEPERARKLYESSLEFCHGNIANRLALMLMEGRGGPPDKALAAKMHLRAITCHVTTVAAPAIRANPGRIDSETWREIQKELAVMGLYKGPVDGIYGRRTIAAVNALWTDEVR